MKSSEIARRLINQTVAKLSAAHEITQGEITGSIMDFYNYIACAADLCDDLVEFSERDKNDSQENDDWLDEPSFKKRNVGENIYIIRDEINDIYMYLKGESKGSLAESLIRISYLLKQTEAVRNSINNFMWRQK